ncbi:hypothetical protein EVAR_45819_1 [Eumeta japonica]|uniref:Uncharacterized protein n=1 Tax=Eumeta variegata TaxID=151549 RepID=A0A4C1WMA0_EUMVA|nr:hypothetical protein EVAR_45819_1 [Eumeta japonica]
MIFYDFPYHLIHDGAPFLANVYNWLNEFKRGPINFSDDLCEGRPSTATIEDNSSAVRLMIETDKRFTHTSLDISAQGKPDCWRGDACCGDGSPRYTWVYIQSIYSRVHCVVTDRHAIQWDPVSVSCRITVTFATIGAHLSELKSADCDRRAYTTKPDPGERRTAFV